MADDKNFLLRIITPERVFFEEEASMVEFNTTEGEIGVYKNHVPMTVIVKPGILTITQDDGVKEAALHSGFVQILQDEITILAEIVEWPEEIDEHRAEAAMERAQERLRQKEAGTDIVRAEIALQKAITRIQVLR